MVSILSACLPCLPEVKAGTAEQGICHICDLLATSSTAQLAVLGAQLAGTAGCTGRRDSPAPPQPCSGHQLPYRRFWHSCRTQQTTLGSWILLSKRWWVFFCWCQGLRSSMSSLANASTSAQDKTGVHGKKHTTVLDHPFQPASASVHC